MTCIGGDHYQMINGFLSLPLLLVHNTDPVYPGSLKAVEIRREIHRIQSAKLDCLGFGTKCCADRRYASDNCRMNWSAHAVTSVPKNLIHWAFSPFQNSLDSHQSSQLLNAFEGQIYLLVCGSQMIQCTFLSDRPVKHSTV
jgi:hypothetical protein